MVSPGTHSSPMLVTLLGIVTLVRLAQSTERMFPMLVSVTNRNIGQARAQKNATYPMLVTLLGIVTLVRLGQLKQPTVPNAGNRQAIDRSRGWSHAPPEPMYLVMVIVVGIGRVRESWACTTTGRVTSRSGSSLAAQTVLKRPVSGFGQVVFAKKS